MKKTWSIIIAAATLIALSGSVWAVSSYWHSYCAKEVIHEISQDSNIELAMNQSKLAILQQRMNWLEQRIWEIEKEYHCPKCAGSIKRTYDNYVTEYQSIQKKIQELTK